MGPKKGQKWDLKYKNGPKRDIKKGELKETKGTKMDKE